MPSLADHQSQRFTKMLLIGDSGTGKTGALASLVEAGYTLRIVDLDNGLDSLVAVLRRKNPDLLRKVEFENFRDKRKAGGQGVVMDGTPKGFVEAMKTLTKWPEDDSVPAQWGDRYILVLDSLTFLGKSAFAWALAMNPGAKDNRQRFFAAQQAVEEVLSLLTSPEFETNVIVISHVNYVERQDGSTKGFPSAIGNALSTKIGAYFNSIAMAETTGSGDKTKRTIRTIPTQMVDLKNPEFQTMPAALPLETGLAEFFRTVQGANKAA